jgi:hypothetical protein
MTASEDRALCGAIRQRPRHSGYTSMTVTARITR